jgi:hypothetical protein
MVSLCGFSNARDKALLRLLRVTSQEKRQQIEAIDILGKDLLEVCSVAYALLPTVFLPFSLAILTRTFYFISLAMHQT